MDYQKLKTAIASLTGTDESIASQMNVVNILSVKNISVASIKQYLIVTGKILAIRASSTPAAMLTVEALNSFDEFVMTDSANVSALHTQLDGLVTASLLNATDKAYILSLSDSFTSLAEQNGLSAVSVGDVQYARAI